MRVMHGVSTYRCCTTNSGHIDPGIKLVLLGTKLVFQIAQIAQIDFRTPPSLATMALDAAKKSKKIKTFNTIVYFILCFIYFIFFGQKLAHHRAKIDHGRAAWPLWGHFGQNWLFE
jgi:hypothetical protein